MPEEHEKIRCESMKISLGGAAANTAYWLSRFGNNVKMVGCLGDDPLGQSCLSELQRAKIDCRAVQFTSNESTAVASIFFNPSSKRMVNSRGANSALDLDKIPFNIFRPETHLHVSFPEEEKADLILQRAKQLGASTSCDFNGLEARQFVENCDYCFMNHDEFKRWFGEGDPIELWRREFPNSNSCLVVTRGENGAIAAWDDQTVSSPAHLVPVVDRTGGGDAFIAGFLTCVLSGRDISSSLNLGLKLASQVISYVGALPEELKSMDLSKA